MALISFHFMPWEFICSFPFSFFAFLPPEHVFSSRCAGVLGNGNGNGGKRLFNPFWEIGNERKGKGGEVDGMDGLEGGCVFISISISIFYFTFYLHLYLYDSAHCSFIEYLSIYPKSQSASLFIQLIPRRECREERGRREIQ
jgi:hypothetical protein